jgi:hypothetical protein
MQTVSTRQKPVASSWRHPSNRWKVRPAFEARRAVRPEFAQVGRQASKCLFIDPIRKPGKVGATGPVADYSLI